MIEARCSQILTEQMTDYAISRRYHGGARRERRAGAGLHRRPVLLQRPDGHRDDHRGPAEPHAGDDGELNNATLETLCYGDDCALSFCAESLCGPDLDACPVSEIKYVTCEIPPGTGAGNPVTVYREGRAPYYANGTQRLTVDYHAPAIESITPALIETTGGEVVLRGRNFGAMKSGTMVTFGGDHLAVSRVNYSHTEMTVTVPSGTSRSGSCSPPAVGRALGRR